MPRSRPPYSPEYRQQMVDLVRGGRTPDSLSRCRRDEEHALLPDELLQVGVQTLEDRSYQSLLLRPEAECGPCPVAGETGSSPRFWWLK